MHQNEVDHMAQGDAVVQIAQRTAQHQCQGDSQPGVIAAKALEPDHQHRTDHHSDQGEQPTLPATTVSEEAESGTGVIGQGPAEVVRNHHDLLEHFQGALEVSLADLVDDQDQQAQYEPTQTSETAGFRHSGEPHRHR